MNEAADSHFTVKLGSDMWPPPKGDTDSTPFDDFTCKHCGEVISVQTCGAFYLERIVDCPLHKHLRNCSEFYGKLKAGVISATLEFHP